MRVSEGRSSLPDEHNSKLKMLEESVMMSLAGHAVPETLLQDVRNIFQQASESFMRDSGVGDEEGESSMAFEETLLCRVSCLLTSPVEAALSNVIISTGLFKHLDFESLKHCRRVCRSWRDIGTKELITRDCCQITIREHPDNNWLAANAPKSVQDLICVMDKSEAFPSSSFQVFSGSMTRLIPFFEKEGDSVQSLNIMELISITNLAFVLKRCPNMVNLKLDLSGLCFYDSDNMYEANVEPFFQYFSDTENERRECKVILPNLRSLEVTLAEDEWANEGVDARVITALIKASPNLLELKNFQCEMTDAIILSNRIDLVKAVHFKPNKENLGKFLTLANHEPRLQELNFECPRMNPRSIQTIQKLLQSSHTSLITLRTDPLGILGNFSVPGPFENLENLTVHHRNVSSSLLPGGVGFSARMFPKLKTIVFEIRVKRPSVNSLFVFQRANNKEDFEQDTIPTVSAVEVRNDMDKHGLYLIGTKFPNLSRLSLKETYYPVKPSDNRIWELLPNSLTALELFDSTFRFNIEEKNFDCVFTGLPLATCKKLLTETEAQAGARSKVKRTKSWIGQLKNLKKLSFILHQEESYTNHVDWTLTTVTVEHAFTEAHELQVVIGYDWGHPMKTVIETKLEPLKPFVAFQHKPAVV